jgi:hypothetical protein
MQQLVWQVTAALITNADFQATGGHAALYSAAAVGAHNHGPVVKSTKLVARTLSDRFDGGPFDGEWLPVLPTSVFDSMETSIADEWLDEIAGGHAAHYFPIVPGTNLVAPIPTANVLDDWIDSMVEVGNYAVTSSTSPRFW